MNNFNIPEDKMASLLNMAAGKLGKDPQQLKDQLESGQLDNVLGGLDPAAVGKINSLLQNPRALDAVLQNEKIKNMLGSLMGGQK